MAAKSCERLPESDWVGFESFVLKRMSETKLPSVVSMAVSDRGVVYSHCFGFKDVESAQPASTRTLYGVASITKTFTALAAGKLVDEGRLDFRDEITKYLPLDPESFGGIEVGHLLSHSSGIPGLGYAEVLIGSAVGDLKGWLPISGLEDMRAFLDEVDEWKTARPGEKVQYLNEGYFLLGEIISRVAKVPYERYLKENVFRPLKMERSFFSKAEVESDPDSATPYLIKEDRAVRSVIPYGCGAGGGLITTAEDLSRLVLMLLQKGEFEGERVVSEATLAELQKPRLPWPLDRHGEDSYGYGFQVSPKFLGHHVIGHGGDLLVYTADYKCAPKELVGSLAMANAEAYPMAQINSYSMAILLGEDPNELPSLRLEGILRRLEGTYTAYKETLTAEVRRNDSFLILSGYDIGTNIILVYRTHDERSASFFTLIAGAKLEVTFETEKEKVTLLYERYRYQKTGPLRAVASTPTIP